MTTTQQPTARSAAQSAQPVLTGIRVLDFSHILAGPFCTRLLADLGADVVRVETSTRPELIGARKPGAGSGGGRPRSLFAFNTNRSKRSIALNLKSEAGHRLATRLASVADVLVENFSAGVMERLRLDYDRLRLLNPGLVYVSMSGYGHDGPRRHWTSMNMNLQAYTGLMMVTGSEGEPPIAISNSWNDYIGGLHACFGVLQALAERRATGIGKNLDLSQFECSVATLGPLVLASAVNRTVPPRPGNRSPHAAPQGCYRCAGQDAWCTISVRTDEHWQALVAAMGAPAWAAEPRLATLIGRVRQHDEIDARIEAWTSRLPAIEVETRLKAAGVPAERMRRIDDVVDVPDGAQVFHPIEDPEHGRVLVTGVPFSSTTNPATPLRPAPALGEHSREVLVEWLGLSEPEIQELEAEGGLV